MSKIPGRPSSPPNIRAAQDSAPRIRSEPTAVPISISNNASSRWPKGLGLRSV